MQAFCWVEIVFILYDSATFSHICYIKMVKELLRIFLFSDFKIISYRIAAGEGRTLTPLQEDASRGAGGTPL